MGSIIPPYIQKITRVNWSMIEKQAMNFSLVHCHYYGPKKYSPQRKVRFHDFISTTLHFLVRWLEKDIKHIPQTVVFHGDFYVL